MYCIPNKSIMYTQRNCRHVCLDSVSHHFVTEVNRLLALCLSLVCSFQCWLDPTKEIKRQIRSKFYLSNYNNSFPLIWLKDMHVSPSILYPSVKGPNLSAKRRWIKYEYWSNKVEHVSPYQKENKMQCWNQTTAVWQCVRVYQSMVTLLHYLSISWLTVVNL